MNHKITNVKIHVTKDYDKFSFLKENRPIVPAKLQRLEACYKQEYFGELFPIKVSPKLAIMDGQHRFLTVKKMGLPVYYVISRKLKMEHIGVINSTQDRWTAYDCVRYYALQGKEHYMVLEAYMGKWGFSLTTALPMLSTSGGGSATDAVRAGIFKVTQNLNEANKYAQRVHDFKGHFKSYKNRSFVIACLDAFTHPDYNHDRMMAKVEYQSMRLVKCTSKEMYLQLLESVYNYKTSINDRVRFSS